MITLLQAVAAAAASTSFILPPSPFAGYDWTGLLIQVYGVVGAVLSLLAGWALTALRAYLVAKTGNQTLATLTGLAGTVVAEIEQTLRQEVQAASADGVITPKERAKLKQVAMDKLLSYASAKGIGIAKGAFGQQANALDNLLGGLIEQAVLGLKQSAPAET